MRTERASFVGGQGTTLGGRLDLPDDAAPQAFAVFAHCFGCTKNLKTIGNLDRVLTAAGLGVLRFDFTGLGDSEGDFSDTNFTSNVSDVAAAAEFLASNYAAPTLLIGHSLGGAAVMQAAKSIGSARAVVTIAAPADLTHLGATIVDQAPDIEADGRGRSRLDRPPFPHQEAVPRLTSNTAAWSKSSATWVSPCSSSTRPPTTWSPLPPPNASTPWRATRRALSPSTTRITSCSSGRMLSTRVTSSPVGSEGISPE